MKTPKQRTTQNVPSFTVFYQENRHKMTSKYPFLSADQINCRLRDQWKKLGKGEKRNFSIPRVYTPPIGKGSIKKKQNLEFPEGQKIKPKKSPFNKSQIDLTDLILSKALKQKSVTDWLHDKRKILPQPRTYSGSIQPIKDVAEVYDRTPHLKTGILKNTDRSVSLERIKPEGRTPAKVTFTPINTKLNKSKMNNNYPRDFLYKETCNSTECIQPKNLNLEFESECTMEEDTLKLHMSYFEEDGVHYSDSDDDNLLYYHHEDEKDETQPTQESQQNSETNSHDQIVPNSSENDTASNTPNEKVPKPLWTPSQSKRKLRPRKRNTSPEGVEQPVPMECSEKEMISQVFVVPKEREFKKKTKLTEGEKMDVESTKAPPVAVEQLEMSEEETKSTSKSSKTIKHIVTSKITAKASKRKMPKVPEIPKISKRKTRNPKPVYNDVKVDRSGDFDDLGNITSKKKMKTKVLPGLFDEYDIEFTSTDDCIKKQDKLIAEFPLFKLSNSKQADSDYKSKGKEDDVKKRNQKKELIQRTKPAQEITKRAIDKEDLNINNNNLDANDNYYENEENGKDKDLQNFIQTSKDNEEGSYSSEEDKDKKEIDEEMNDDGQLFKLKDFGSFQLPKLSKSVKPESFSSCYDEEDDDDDIQTVDDPNCSTSNTLQKILSNLRHIGSQSSVEEDTVDVDQVEDSNSPKLLSPTLSGVSELSSLSEVENSNVMKKKPEKNQGQPRKTRASMKTADDPPVFYDSHNKIIPNGDICELFDEISPRNKKSRDRRLAASNPDVGHSNFGVLFQEEDIFL